jgi:DNA-binding NtrC family response regulator
MTEEKNTVLVVTANKPLFEAISIGLRDSYTCVLSQPLMDSIAQIHEQKPSCILFDLDSHESNTRGLLQSMLGMVPQVPVVILASEKDSEILARLTELGAYDYLYSPFERNRLLITVRNASTARVRIEERKEEQIK